MSVTLRTESVTKRFGGLNAVSEVSMTVEAGSITGLIGPNGAGKSTVFDLMTRVLDVTQGRLLVDEEDVTDLAPASLAQMGVARTFQTPRGFASLSVLENVEAMLHSSRETVFGALFRPRHRGSLSRDRAMEALARVGLERRARDRFGDQSGGEHRMLEIARHLAREPKALLLDEPTAGVHPSLQDRLRDVLRQLNREGVTILLVEHNLGFLMSIASYVHVMALGRLLASGLPADVANDPVVVDAYFGRSSTARGNDAVNS